MRITGGSKREERGEDRYDPQEILRGEERIGRGQPDAENGDEKEVSVTPH